MRALRGEERYRQQIRGELPSGPEDCRSRASGLLRTGLEARAWPELLAAHEAALAHASPVAEGEASLLELKRAMAWRLLSPCRQCWLRCEVDRAGGELGRCELGPELRVYNDFVHFGEEDEVVPTHAVFLAGCNFRCVFCSDGPHVTEPTDDPVTRVATLAARIEDRAAAGVRSLSFIGGVPDVNLAGILDALCLVRGRIPPLVWNSNMSASVEAERVLEGLVDAYIADLKFGGDACAEALAGVSEHQALVLPRIQRAQRSAFVIVRHLLMPGHLDCCAIPVLERLAAAVPGARVELMDQFMRPASMAPEAAPELSGAVAESRVSALRERAEALGLRTRPLIEPGPIPEGTRAPGFASDITIQADGSVVIENLDAGLLGLARDLDPGDPGLAARAQLPDS